MNVIYGIYKRTGRGIPSETGPDPLPSGCLAARLGMVHQPRLHAGGYSDAREYRPITTDGDVKIEDISIEIQEAED